MPQGVHQPIPYMGHGCSAEMGSNNGHYNIYKIAWNKFRYIIYQGKYICNVDPLDMFYLDKTFRHSLHGVSKAD